MANEPTSIGRYKILSELGQGAMARVYLALDPNIGRKVALKVLEPRGLVAAIEMDELRTRFLFEARAAGNLRHPAAVAIYDAAHDSETGHSYIAMEWVDGQSLDDLLKQKSTLPVDQAVSIISQVAGALDAAHAQGLIHRDVKPANILLDQEGNAKLSDFGIAKAESLELTSTGQVLGTPFYMSPEQIRDDDLDGRSDLFSLGVVLYQAVIGKQPFHAASLPALTHKILHTEPEDPHTKNGQIPQAMASAIIKSLEKDPDKRFQTGAELAEAIGGQALATSATVGLTQASLYAKRAPEYPSSTRIGRRPWSIIGTVLLAATLVITLAAIWKGDSPEKPALPAPTTNTGQAHPIEQPIATDSISRADISTASPIVANSTLQISYTNRLKKATMEVWVDGELALSKPLSSPRGFFRRIAGRTILESMPVTAGHHDVKVSIRGSAGKIEASNWSGNTFEEGKTRRLRVELIPPSYLKLVWK
jgi:serine/threonine protein kinase